MKARFALRALLIIALLFALSAFADERSGPVGRMTVSASAVEWQASVDNERLILTVQLPTGAVITREFVGTHATFRPQDAAPFLVSDGVYQYDLRSVPRISSDTRRRLAEARAKDDDAAIARIQSAAGLTETLQSGAFSMQNGLFVVDTPEPRSEGKRSLLSTGLKPAPNDVVTADDEIIQGSLCVGLDCVNNESFGFDTLRLKENNTRIVFYDTSTSAGFPNVHWQLTANDSNSGGANKFSIDDLTNSKTPFTIRAAAPTNSLFVASTGKVGFGNSSPGLNLHITATDTPAIRQEQTSGGGFTAQTWDIGGNEANWFVRDLTGGSRLPLRIRPGAPTSSVDISAAGNVGIGTASPTERLTITGGHEQLDDGFAIRWSGSADQIVGSSSAHTLRMDTNGGTRLFVDNQGRLGVGTTSPAEKLSVASGHARLDDGFAVRWGGTTEQILMSSSAHSFRLDANGATRLFITSAGNLGVNTSTPTNPIEHSNGAFLSVGGVWQDASSRSYKDNICDLDSGAAMDALRSLNPVTFTYKRDPKEHHVGFIAEDVPDLVAAPDRNAISPMDVVAVLTKVVQEQQKTIDELKARLDALAKKQ